MNLPAPTRLAKGIGPALDGGGLPPIGAMIWESGGDFPQLTLNATRLSGNIAEMARYVSRRGARLAPHGKTAMSPEIAQMQLDAGAWAITAASPAQLRVYRAAGFSRLLLANELVEPNAIAWLQDESDRDPGFECYVGVDSAAGLALLRRDGGVGEIRVLIEVGHPGGRTGARSAVAARELVLAAQATPGIRVAGLTAYEGTLGGEPTPETLAEVRRFSRELGELAERLRGESLLPADSIVSIGGSAFFDEALAGLGEGGVAASRIVLRSGAYATHDDLHYREVTPSARNSPDAPRFLPAITIWAPVLSRPEPGLALLLCGRRDVGFDEGLPLVRGARRRDGSGERALAGAEVAQLADQHAFLRLPADAELEVGDLVELGISHPCTTLDRWCAIPLVDDEHRILSLIRTFFS